MHTNESSAPKILKTSFPENLGHPHSKSPASSDKPVRPKTPYPSVMASKSTPAVSTYHRTHRSLAPVQVIESKGSKDSKENTLMKLHRSRTIHSSTVSDIKAAFHTLRNERNPSKARISDIKSVFNMHCAGLGLCALPKMLRPRATPRPTSWRLHEDPKT